MNKTTGGRGQRTGIRRQKSEDRKMRSYEDKKIKLLNFLFSQLLKFSSLLLTVYCLMPTEVHAEDKVITLSDAWRSAIASYETIMLSQEDLFQAEKGIDKALSQILPSLTADADYTQYSEGVSSVQPENSSSFSLKLTQPLYSGGKEWSLWRQAKKKTEANKRSLEATKEKIMLNVAQAYYAVLKAEKTVEIKEAALKRAMEQRRVASARFQVGEVTKSVVLRAEAEVAGAEAEHANAKKDLLVAKDKLARLIGVLEDFKVSDPNIQPLPDTNLDTWTSLSLEKRQDYMQSKIEEEVAEEGINYAFGNFLPSFKLEGVYTKRDQDPKTFLFNDESMFAGVIFTYPLFEGGLRKAELDEAKSKRRQAEFKKVSIKKDIELEVREAFHNLETFTSVIESHKRQVSFAEENYNMVFKQFSYGLATNVDVIDANTTLVSSQSNLVNAIYDYQTAIIELKKRVGILFEDMKSAKQ